MEIVTESAAKTVLHMDAAIVLMEKTFAGLARGECELFAVVQGRGPTDGARFSAKSGSIGHGATLGLKVGSYWPDNRERGLPNHNSTTLLLDPLTGSPQALVAASYLNRLRTAAADGAAIKCLARLDARTLGLIGAGHQAWFELRAACAVRDIREACIWSRDAARADAIVQRARIELNIVARSASLKEAAGCDIVVTVTAATEPLVRREWVRPGTHISAMGADAPGKQELQVELVADARLFADVVSQSISLGEFERACADELIEASDIHCLGDVLVGRAAGRQHAAQITIFDSSGIAAQDLSIAQYALDAARRAGLVHTIDL